MSRVSPRPVLLADDREGTADSVERLMGTKAEARFAFISDKAEFASDDLLDALKGHFRAISGISGRLAPEFARFPGISRSFVFRWPCSSRNSILG
jgi:hypothetical protein